MGGYNQDYGNLNIDIHGNGTIDGGAALQSAQMRYASGSSYSQNPISVVNPDLVAGTPDDKFEINSLQKVSSSDYVLGQRLILHKQKVVESGTSSLSLEEKEEKFKPYQDLEEVRKTLADECQKAGISFSKLSVLMTALTGKSLKEFHSLYPEFQSMLLNYIIESIERVKKANLPDVDILEAVVADAAMMYKFIACKDGVCVDIASLTPNEIKERRECVDKEFKAKKAARLAELEALSPEEKKEAEAALMNEMSEQRKHIFENLSKKISFESALELLLIVSVKDLGDEAKSLMESYPIEIREKIANTMHSFESFKEYIKIVQGRGESLGDEKAQQAFEQYNKIFGTYKTKENLEKYEQQFVEARTRGELPEEVVKPTAMGIGEAAYANINMTSEEKQTFIQKWVADNDGLLTDADMAQVETVAKEYIKELIEKNPQIRERFNYIKKTIKEIVEKTLDREFKPHKTDESKQNKEQKSEKTAENIQEQVQKYSFINSPQTKIINNNVLSFVKELLRVQAAKFECPAIEKTDEQITTALLRGIISYDNAVKNLDNSEHRFIKLCVKNSSLAAIYDDKIDNYIKRENDNDKLREIAEVAPRRYVEKIVKKMRGDNKELAEELIKMHKVDYNTKVTLEAGVLSENNS